MSNKNQKIYFLAHSIEGVNHAKRYFNSEDIAFVPTSANVELHLFANDYECISPVSVVGNEGCISIHRSTHNSLSNLITKINDNELQIFLNSYAAVLVRHIAWGNILSEALRFLITQSGDKTFIVGKSWYEWFWRTFSPLANDLQIIVYDDHSATYSKFKLLRLLANMFNRLAPGRLLAQLMKSSISNCYLTPPCAQLYIPRTGHLKEFVEEMITLTEPVDCGIVIGDETDQRYTEEHLEKGFRFILEERKLYYRNDIVNDVISRTLVTERIVSHLDQLMDNVPDPFSQIFRIIKIRYGVMSEIRNWISQGPIEQIFVDGGARALQRMFLLIASTLEIQTTILSHGLILANDHLHLTLLPQAKISVWGEWMKYQMDQIGVSTLDVGVVGTRRVMRDTHAQTIDNTQFTLLFAPSWIHDTTYFTDWKEHVEGGKLLKSVTDNLKSVSLSVRSSPRGKDIQTELWENDLSIPISADPLIKDLQNYNMFAVISSTVFCDFLGSGKPVVIIDTRGWIENNGLPFGMEQGVYRIRNPEEAPKVIQAMIDEIISGDTTLRDKRLKLFRKIVKVGS